MCVFLFVYAYRRYIHKFYGHSRSTNLAKAATAIFNLESWFQSCQQTFAALGQRRRKQAEKHDKEMVEEDE